MQFRGLCNTCKKVEGSLCEEKRHDIRSCTSHDPAPQPPSYEEMSELLTEARELLIDAEDRYESLQAEFEAYKEANSKPRRGRKKKGDE